jgi:hypothetical protein
VGEGKRPDETAERFSRDGIEGGGRLHRTVDAKRWLLGDPFVPPPARLGQEFAATWTELLRIEQLGVPYLAPTVAAFAENARPVDEDVRMAEEAGT